MQGQEKIIKLVSDAANIDASQLSATTSFIDDLNLDSLDIVELMMKMEDEFNVEIPEEDAEKMRTIGDIVTYLKDKNVSL